MLLAEYDRVNREFNLGFAAAIVGEKPEVYQELVKACVDNLENSVRDPELRRKLTPDYQVGCKRLVVSEHFYAAIQQPNAELVTEKIERIEANGVRTRDGRLHELDLLILATGFNTHQFFRPMTVVGRDGLNLNDAWADKNEAYKSITMPGFPNWFMLGGPNSPIGNYSWLLTLERQMDYAMQLINLLAAGNVSEIAPKASATRAFNEAMAAKFPGTIWASGCKSWYLDKKGRVAAWPWNYEKFIEDMREPNLKDAFRQ
jgi:cyclohexanone monooxygenase